MNQTRNGDRPSALVTGGAGLIGSHLSDLLLAEGWRVRILDNLEPQTHGGGRPTWVPEAADFVVADVCDREALLQALQGVDTVFHQAAYGGYAGDGEVHLHEQLRYRATAGVDPR